MGVTKLALVGAGSRGLFSYAPYALKYPNAAQIVAVAEPRQEFRDKAAALHSIPAEAVFNDWCDLASRPRLADAVIIATPDRMHYEAALRFAELGYHILLEKPMAPTEAECRAIVDSASRAGIILAVCHVLRYTPYFQKLKELLDSGVLGQISVVNHIEHVAYWHFVHSYVRGNWRNEALSAPALLAKSCHDLDILLYLLNRKCISLSSAGQLSHFRTDNKPIESTKRCFECPLVTQGCPYSAHKFYLGRFNAGLLDWPLNVITNDISVEGINHALKTGPYGRCAYDCDNDVVDHQTVSMLFEGGVTVNFAMNAFSADEYRQTEIFGSHGELRGDSHRITVRHFDSGDTSSYEIARRPGGHYGGDEALMHDFVQAVSKNRPDLITSGPEVSLLGHLMVFAAERARKNGSVEPII